LSLVISIFIYFCNCKFFSITGGWQLCLCT